MIDITQADSERFEFAFFYCLSGFYSFAQRTIGVQVFTGNPGGSYNPD
jgi:hypothetical protein